MFFKIRKGRENNGGSKSGGAKNLVNKASYQLLILSLYSATEGTSPYHPRILVLTISLSLIFPYSFLTLSLLSRRCNRSSLHSFYRSPTPDTSSLLRCVRFLLAPAEKLELRVAMSRTSGGFCGNGVPIGSDGPQVSCQREVYSNLMGREFAKRRYVHIFLLSNADGYESNSGRRS